MTLTLLTHYLPTERENYQELADIIIPERDAYCARHSYRHLVHSGPYKDPSLYYAIQRLWRLYDDMIGPDATDAYWVLNIQSVITSHLIPVGQYLDDTHDFFIAADVHGINAGSFLVRNTEWGRAYVKSVAERAPFINHCWHEQKVMQDDETQQVANGTMKLCPPNQFNSYQYFRYSWPDSTPGDWRKGDLCLSLPGLNLAQRLEIVRDIMKSDMIVR